MRRLSWRPTTSASAAPNASASSAPAQPQRQRHVVDRRGPLELVEEPQPALGKRQRNHRGPLARHQRLQPTFIAADTGRQLGDRGRLEHGPHRKAGIQAGVDRGDQAHRRQRIPTQVEERVVDPNPVDTEDLGVDAGQDLLDRAGGGAITTAILIFRCRQGAGVEFAVNRQRQLADHHHRGRNHVGRQPLGQRGAHLGRVCGPGDIADQALVAGTVLAGDHHRLLHSIERGQRGLDFTEFDAIPADLDLLIGAPQVLQLPIGAPPHQIPGAIHPCPALRPRERARHKPRRRQTRPAPIATPHAAAGHIQFTDHPGRHRPQPAIQHKQRRAGHRLNRSAALPPPPVTAR